MTPDIFARRLVLFLLPFGLMIGTLVGLTNLSQELGQTLSSLGKTAAQQFLLVTYPRLDLVSFRLRWRTGDRSPLGTPSPWVSRGPRPPFHRTRTVARAARMCEARLGKDGIRWM